jgi:hypothetical protein
VDTHPSRVFGQLVYQQYIGFELNISPFPELKQQPSPSLAVDLCDSDGDGDDRGDGDRNGYHDGNGDGNGDGFYDGDERVGYYLVTNEMTIDVWRNRNHFIPWIGI